ncbi:MAG: glycoside hydrolase family 2 TIM barrel-domain containing protein, partial [Lentisphaeria bacterium]|nr:glycoside hydrolase family 2 TIM barrel-domain containing protein [Lentisphaeria bacterium]
MRHTLLALSLLALASLAAAETNLVRNGDFQAVTDGQPDGWSGGPGISVVQEGGKRWLRVEPGKTAGQNVPLDPDTWEIRLTMRLRATNVEMGAEGWQDARLAMSFHNDKNERIGPWPNVFHAVGTTDWIDCDRTYRVPEGAVRLNLGAAVFGPKGTAEFADLKIVVTRTRTNMKNDEPLPAGVADVWRLADAWKATTPTRERICVNGLWQFRPVAPGEDTALVPPANDCWGWFPVPGIWGTGSSPDTWIQPLVLAPWIEERIELQNLDQAWSKRSVTAPADWAGRRVWLDATMVQTHAAVFVDGKPAGEIWFPGGRLELTDHLRPGREQTLAILATARPIEKESQVFMAPDRIVTSKASIKLKGLTGDVYLISEPAAEAVDGVQAMPSCRQSRLDFAVELRQPGNGPRRLVARILDGDREVKTIRSDLLPAAERLVFGDTWRNPKLWDTDTPENLYTAIVSLHDENDRLIDQFEPFTFGFREFWIEGRDFILNGSPVRLRALHNRNINSGADLASREGSLDTIRRMQQYGFNFLITANYNFSPGEVGYLDGLFEAADQTGMLCAFSLPHVKDFNWRLDQPEPRARYEAMTRWLVRRARNHPAVVLYAMNHNSTGYHGDQNPLKMDGIYQPEDHTDTQQNTSLPYPARNRLQATIAADIAKALDPTRPVYHHQSGNLGDMHTVNIYLNWAPPQERDDWLAHWEANGRKPMFFVEWGLPHISSWSSYRGPQFIWRCLAFQSLWDAEFSAPFIGERAYAMGERKQQSIAHEESLWAKGEPFAWGVLNRHLHGTEECHYEIMSLFAETNWRSHRAHGISAMLPWDQGGIWQRRNRGENRPLDWQSHNLQQPGIVAAFSTPGGEYIYDNGPDEDYKPSSIGRTFLRWNQPLCAFLGGGPESFTDRGHNLLPGGILQQQLVILNDTRRSRQCRAAWTSPFGKGDRNLSLAPGTRALFPVRLHVPRSTAPGEYAIEATFTFDDGTVQTDRFAVHVLAPPVQDGKRAPVALLDPNGETARLLDDLGQPFRQVEATDSLEGVDLLVVGRNGLATPVPALARLRDGMRVLVFEQDADILRDRLGFRVNLQGLRQVFPRVPHHPVFAGLTADNLRDWQGEATSVPPFLPDLPAVEPGYPRWDWHGFQNTRVWRAGNRGSVATILIEKPPRGNWTALADGGFDLQYAPLLEGVFGQGRILFCQLDVTARTASDPAAEQLCRNLISYLRSVPAPLHHPLAVLGGEETQALAKALGVKTAPDAARLLVGPGADLAQARKRIEQGAQALALGLSAEEAQQLVPGIQAEPVAAYSTLADLADPLFAGLAAAELHWRTKLDYAAVAASGPVAENGSAALRAAALGQGRVVFCQVAPWMLNEEAKPYLRTSKRRNLFLVAQLLDNLAVRLDSPLPELLASPARSATQPLEEGWRGLVDREDQGRNQNWFLENFDDTAWKPIQVGATFESQIPELAEYDGAYWYRLRFQVPETIRRDEDITLHIGAIDDESAIWLNGQLLGEVTAKTHPDNYWSF